MIFVEFSKIVYFIFAFSLFLPLVSSDGTTVVLPSAKLKLFANIFASNSTLDDSGYIFLLLFPHLFIPNFVISSKYMNFTLCKLMPFLSLTLRRTYLMASHLWFLNLVLLSMHPVLVNIFVCDY